MVSININGSFNSSNLVLDSENGSVITNDSQKLELKNFDWGVASGEPTNNSILLWTKYNTSIDTELTWEVMNKNTNQVIKTGKVMAKQDNDFTVKVSVTGLEAGKEYSYRFLEGNNVSRTGNCKTLPTNVSEIKLAIFSCSEFMEGYYNVHRSIAESDVDFAICLGDIIYEMSNKQYKDYRGKEPLRNVVPNNECVTEVDYQERHAQNHKDEDLQLLFASKTCICIWDDHEVVNDSWAYGAEGHNSLETSGNILSAPLSGYEYTQLGSQTLNLTEGEDVHDYVLLKIFVDGGGDPTTWNETVKQATLNDLLSNGLIQLKDQGSYLERKANAMKAYYQYMPKNTNTSYGQYKLGNLINLILTDTRSNRGMRIDDIVATGVMGDVTELLQATLNDPNRKLFGDDQEQFINSKTDESTNFTWTLLASSVQFANNYTDKALVSKIQQTLLPGLTDEERANRSNELANDVATYALEKLSPTFVKGEETAWSYDTIDGYPYWRQWVYNIIKNKNVTNFITIAGDSHDGWCSRLVDNSNTKVGYEIATPSVAQRGLAELVDAFTPDNLAYLANTLFEDNEWAGLGFNGWTKLTFTESKLKSEWFAVSTIFSKVFDTNKKWKVEIENNNSVHYSDYVWTQAGVLTVNGIFTQINSDISGLELLLSTQTPDTPEYLTTAGTLQQLMGSKLLLQLLFNDVLTLGENCNVRSEHIVGLQNVAATLPDTDPTKSLLGSGDRVQLTVAGLIKQNPLF